MAMKCSLVIPVKTFSSGKSRLASKISLNDRKNLIATCLKNTIELAKKSDYIDKIVVVSNGEQVKSFADTLEVECHFNNLPLNQALRKSVALLGQHCQKIIISPADTILLQNFEAILNGLKNNRIVLCPDRHRTGTNIIAHDSELEFCYRYGPKSFGKHLFESLTFNRPIEILQEVQYSFDIDTLEDIAISESIK
jgi:2-phospho-L-lactate guanylyltransferase